MSSVTASVPPTSSDSPQMSSKVTVVTGDLFSAPKNSILVHACNTQGSWGAGIAKAFRDRFPDAFNVYKARCKNRGDKLIGTCFLIRGETHDIACLFTSRKYGRAKDSPEEILQATESAVKDMLKQNAAMKKALHGCKFNSGKFGVPWEKTVAVLDALGTEMTVYDFPEGPPADATRGTEGGS